MATNPFTSPTISGYNASPPADDGTAVASNQLNWSKHKTKLADPIKTLAEATVTNASAAFAKVINTDANENNAMAGSLAITESTLTIASGSVTATRSAHVMAAETGTTDTLTNITTGSVSDNCLLVIRPDTGDTITVQDAATGAGEIHLADNTNYAMSGDMSLTLQRRGADWYEITRDQGIATAATQAEQETGSSTTVFVTPGRQQYHASAAKGWVDAAPIGGTGAITADASYNVNSVDDDGTGLFGVNWETDFSSVNYSVAGTGEGANTRIVHVASRAVGATELRLVNDGDTPTDPVAFNIVAYGDQ